MMSNGEEVSDVSTSGQRLMPGSTLGTYPANALDAVLSQEPVGQKKSVPEEAPAISVRWSVRDVPEAVLSVMSWAWAHDGQVHGVDGHHLRIELPSQHVAAFLRAFSNADDALEAQALLQAADGPLADAPQDRAVISLELIVPQ